MIQSKISFINGTDGILRYRGYPIEQLAERSSFLETAFLLIYGNLVSSFLSGKELVSRARLTQTDAVWFSVGGA